MDKNNNPPKGRGSLLEIMRKKQTQHRHEGLSHSLETPSNSSSDQTRISEQSSHHLQSSFGSSVGRGRFMLNMAKLSTTSQSESTSSSSVGVGRGSLFGLMQRVRLVW